MQSASLSPSLTYLRLGLGEALVVNVDVDMVRGERLSRRMRGRKDRGCLLGDGDGD